MLADWVIKQLEKKGVIRGLPDPSDENPNNDRYWLQLEIANAIIEALQHFAVTESEILNRAASFSAIIASHVRRSQRATLAKPDQLEKSVQDAIQSYVPK